MEAITVVAVIVCSALEAELCIRVRMLVPADRKAMNCSRGYIPQSIIAAAAAAGRVTFQL